MDHEAHILLVDPHAEGVGGHHDPDPVEEELILVLPAVPFAHARMVGPGRDAAFPELLRHPLHLFPGGAVDDAAVLGMLGDELLQRRHFIGGAQHPERQVFPVESRDPDLRLPQGKMRQDVVPDSRRRRSGKGRQNRPARKLFHKGRDGHVGGPEVVPPLGHAVGLVHRDQ